MDWYTPYLIGGFVSSGTLILCCFCIIKYIQRRRQRDAITPLPDFDVDIPPFYIPGALLESNES